MTLYRSLSPSYGFNKKYHIKMLNKFFSFIFIKSIFVYNKKYANVIIHKRDCYIQ